jgi:FkbM family methyltransferase
MFRYLHLFRNISNWWLHFAIKFSLTNADPLLFKTRNNIYVEVPRRILHEFKEIFIEECYVKGLELEVPRRPTVIDIGANAGFFTLFAASRFPGARIFSFEPINSNFKQLQRNRDLNENCHIMIFPKAVFGHPGQVSLSFDPTDSFTTAATVLGKFNEQDNTIQVPCVTLPEIFEDHHLDRCELLKMDCEGSEYSVLYNCPSDYLKRIVQLTIEVHGGSESDQNKESLGNYLRSHGFEIRMGGHMLWAWRV